MSSRKAASRRSVQRLGRDVTVHNYEWDGTKNQYGDPSGFTESTVETKALFQYNIEDIQKWLGMAGASGNEVEIRMAMFIPDDIEIHMAGDDERTKASVVDDSLSHKKWKILDVFDQDNGVKACLGNDI